MILTENFEGGQELKRYLDEIGFDHISLVHTCEEALQLVIDCDYVHLLVVDWEMYME